MPLLTVQMQAALKIRNDIVFTAIYSGRCQTHDREVHLSTMARLILANSRKIVAEKPIIDTKIPSPRGDKMCLIYNHKTNTTLSEQILDVMREKQFRR